MSLTKSNLHGYQNVAWNHLCDNQFACLFLDMGLGKTVSTLTAIDELIYGSFEINKVLIIAPKAVAEGVWHKEIAKWRHLQHLTISRVIGTPKQRVHALKESADVYVIGRDNVAWLCAHYGGLKLPFDMLVIDEISSFKNHQSKRFKQLRKVIRSFKRRVGLTGTPSPNSLLDLWGPMFLIDAGQRLGAGITEFRRNYFRKEGYGFVKYVPRNEQVADQIYDRIRDICLSMKAKDYLDMPPRIDNYIDVELPKKAKKYYDRMKRDMYIGMLGDSGDLTELTVANAAALSMKLTQMANGAAYDADRNVVPIHDAKLDRLEEIIDTNIQGNILVAYTFIHDRNRIMARLGSKAKVFSGLEADIDAWNAGDIPVMLIHPKSAGHGLNLQQGGNVIIWFGQTWSSEEKRQLDARLYRQGQTRPVIVHHLIASGTIDQRIKETVDEKVAGEDALMAVLKAEFKGMHK